MQPVTRSSAEGGERAEGGAAAAYSAAIAYAPDATAQTHAERAADPAGLLHEDAAREQPQRAGADRLQEPAAQVGEAGAGQGEAERR